VFHKAIQQIKVARFFMDHDVQSNQSIVWRPLKKVLRGPCQK